MIQTVKLSKLRQSDLNVRKSGDLSIEQLAADIEARGVLQNLLVTPLTKPRGTFAVFAGGRRLRALQLLAEAGRIDADTYDVPVQVLKGDDNSLSEASLAENFHQLKMTPAEECRAFQHFIGQDGDIDAVAKRFGVTRRFVEGRLRLASLAEPIFAALAEGRITLDMAKAYASTEDRERQLMIFEQYGSYGYTNADSIRRMIANETMRATAPVALLVGADAYVAAGGKIDRDLFTDDGDKWVNPEVAQRLAAEIMEAEAKRIGEETGLAWIRPIASSQTYSAAAGLYPVRLPAVPPTDEERARLEAIDHRLDDIMSEMEDEELSEEAYQALDAESDELAQERYRLVNRPAVLPDELKTKVGAFLTLSHKGEMVLDPTYYSEEPLTVADPDGAGEGASVTAAHPIGGATVPPRDAPPEAVAPGGKPLSARLADELAMQRRDVLAAALLSHPALALDLAIFAMVDKRGGYAQLGTTVRAGAPQDPVLGGDLPASAARTALAEAADTLDSSWTSHGNEVDRFEAFRGLDDDAKAAWLAYAVATSLEAKASSATQKQNPLQNRLASIMAVDVASWWRPTSENFFDRVSKGALLVLLGEVGGPALADRYAGAKKAEISRSCHALFAGEAIVEAEVKEKALAWVPDAMRFLDSAEGSLEEPGSEDVLDAANDPQGGDEGVEETAASAADGFEVPDEEAVPVAA
jgi:ParB family transcriptional regulator, chromosome partitioning protein